MSFAIRILSRDRQGAVFTNATHETGAAKAEHRTAPKPKQPAAPSAEARR